ncbi:hypothetical protein [Amycolatopsis thermophila]|uniref:Transposase n=1 Tax=Amycolatopsis thermophila TaxID=206084 RepID=A0ABU0EPH3_9PSEU|nr:hypothetical protein [Amycolatopsis thermophila]MDQ0377064.1 hypothetical protein [Amycolatopsis thermophila]
MPSRFDEVADELYALPRDEFTAARTERAKAAKARRPDLAKQIGGLRKPTVAAWLVNQVSRRHADDVGQLADLGEQLRSAHQKLAGNDLRTLSRQRNELIRKLSGFASTIAAEAGVAYSDAAERQVEATFEAAVSTPDAAAEVLAGRLSTALTPSSSEDWLAAALAASPRTKTSGPPPKKPAPKKPPEKPAATKPRKDPDAERRRAALDEAREKLASARNDRDEARQAMQELSDRAEKAAAVVTDLRERLDEAVKEERALRKEAFGARKALTAAEKAADEAGRRLEEMESFGRRR